MGNWCCTEAGVNAQMVNYLTPGMTLQELDEAICQGVNVIPPPSAGTLPRPLGTYTSGATLRDFLLEHCEGCSGRRERGGCD